MKWLVAKRIYIFFILQIVFADLDPCINVSCDYFAVCKAFRPNHTRCICEYTCPSFKDPVCSSNGTTYDNECMFQREMCYLRANFTIYHPGDCTGNVNKQLGSCMIWQEFVFCVTSSGIASTKR